jgi:PmbA protein
LKKKTELKVEPQELASDLAKKLKSKSPEGWEIFLQSEQGVAIEARDQKLESFENEKTLALAIRVIDQGRPGFAYCSDFRDQQVSRLLDEVLNGARHADRDQFLTIPETNGLAPAMPAILDPGFSKLNEREKIKRAMEMEKAALDFDSRIKRVRGCEYHENLAGVWIMNSNGLDRSCSSSRYSLSISAVAEQGKEAQMAGEFAWSFRYNMLDALRLGESVAGKALSKLGAKPIKSRKAAVVFSPEVAGEFMDLLSFALNGESLAKHKTWLAGTEGKKIFSKNITVVDNGLFEKGPECSPFDDEGVNSRKKELVRDGVVKQFIFDSYYGKRMKKSSTGNARREMISVPPNPGPSNFYLAPGKKSREDMIASIGSGFLLEEVLGMHMADEISGDFSVGVGGHLIENGKISRPVSGVAIAGNLKDLFSRVAEVGDDLKFFNKTAAPSILIEEMEISGS